MKIVSNKVSDIIHFFRSELDGLYDKGEIETFITYCFETYTEMKRATIFLNSTRTVSESELLKFNFAVKDLKRHKPIQYILGVADFYGMKLNVNPHVLIPRPETEELVQLVIIDNGKWKMKNGATPLTILDIGTGSGCIAIALKKNIPQAVVHAIDLSDDALKTARQNALENNTEIVFSQQDILAENVSINNDTLFDVIVSNPPYIKLSEQSTMSSNVLDYEPHTALFVPNEKPLLFYEAIANFAIRFLKPNGKIYFEINQQSGNEVVQLLKEKKFSEVELIKDLNNNNRIVTAQLN